jgi:hypothetical protein
VPLQNVPLGGEYSTWAKSEELAQQLDVYAWSVSETLATVEASPRMTNAREGGTFDAVSINPSRYPTFSI